MTRPRIVDAGATLALSRRTTRRESAQIYTSTEQRERHGQRTD